MNQVVTFLLQILKKNLFQGMINSQVPFSFNDGECVESVVMSYKHGYSICISTQVGCKMGCTFCATGKSGFSRSLAPSEMLGQIEAAQRDLNIRISNIVLMGMGEPLDNYDNVVKFLRLVYVRQRS